MLLQLGLGSPRSSWPRASLAVEYAHAGGIVQQVRRRFVPVIGPCSPGTPYLYVRTTTRNACTKGPSMPLSPKERSYIRDLATRVAEIAAHPYNAERREMWYRHNGLERVKPMVLVFPEGSWPELLPDSRLTIEDPVWRQHEFYLLHVIYRWEHLRDDNVIEPYMEIPSTRSVSGWGLTAKQTHSTTKRGAWKYDPVLREESDFEKMTPPVFSVDLERKRQLWEDAEETVGDILQVRRKRGVFVNLSLVNMLCYWRGLEQVMTDMIERPEWLHRVFTFMMENTQRLLDELEASGELELNNSNDYAGSGGVSYTRELPAKDFTGTVRLKDMWGFAESQEYTLVSPAMYDDFGIRYQAPLLERCGMSCYGCCEGMNDKLDLIVRKVPRLRRLSISPWTDVRIAAEKLGDKVIYSWKPDPTIVTNPYDPERMRAYLRDAVEATKGCVFEMVLKDTHTCNSQPQRMTEWVEIAKQVAEEAA